jgi:hypothetical protein
LVTVDTPPDRTLCGGVVWAVHRLRESLQVAVATATVCTLVRKLDREARLAEFTELIENLFRLHQDRPICAFCEPAVPRDQHPGFLTRELEKLRISLHTTVQGVGSVISTHAKISSQFPQHRVQEESAITVRATVCTLGRLGQTVSFTLRYLLRAVVLIPGPG